MSGMQQLLHDRKVAEGRAGAAVSEPGVQVQEGHAGSGAGSGPGVKITPSVRVRRREKIARQAKPPAPPSFANPLYRKRGGADGLVSSAGPSGSTFSAGTGSGSHRNLANICKKDRSHERRSF